MQERVNKIKADAQERLRKAQEAKGDKKQKEMKEKEKMK